VKYKNGISLTAHLFIILILTFFFSCKDKEQDNIPETPGPAPVGNYFIRGADMSYLPFIEDAGAVFYNSDSMAQDPLVIMKNHGVNTIRVRLWKDPADPNSSFPVVKQFAERIKSDGLKLWITVHYSDTWADPGQQTMPHQWEGISYEALKDSVYEYTSKIVTEMQPDYIQIGNEINDGFLWPEGRLSINKDQFIELLTVGVQAVHDHSDSAKAMVHYAGLNYPEGFFSNLIHVPYDIIGISYYPWWHGKDLDNLESNLKTLSQKFNRGLVIAETAYPFTLGWNDWTNNLVGLEDHLILPEYPATYEGQKKFMLKIREVITNVDGNGFCYWGAELIAWDGPESPNGSSWENLALFNFNNKVVPAIEAFEK